MNILFHYFVVLFDSVPRSENCNLIWENLCVSSSTAIIIEILTLKTILFRWNSFQLTVSLWKVVAQWKAYKVIISSIADQLKDLIITSSQSCFCHLTPKSHNCSSSGTRIMCSPVPYAGVPLVLILDWIWSINMTITSERTHWKYKAKNKKFFTLIYTCNFLFASVKKINWLEMHCCYILN